MEPILINVKYQGGTNLATARGRKERASATSCPQDAVGRLAFKIMGESPYQLKRATTYTWILSVTEDDHGI